MTEPTGIHVTAMVIFLSDPVGPFLPYACNQESYSISPFCRHYCPASVL